MIRSRSRLGAAALCALVAVVTACGGSDESSSSSAAPTETTGSTESTTAETTTPAEDPLGEENPATGPDLEIAYMWAGVSPSVDNTSDINAAKAVVEWINTYGGGIGTDHRKLVLVDCGAPDAATAASCGSKIVDEKYPITLFNVIGDVEPWATPTLAAGIPIFGFQSADAALRESPDMAFTLSNPLSSIGAFPAALAKQIGAAKTVMEVINVPGAAGPVQALAPIVFEELGAGEVVAVPIDPTSTDHSADVQTGLQGNPDLWHVIGNPAFCSLGVKALRDAGYEGTISLISNCLDANAIKQLGSQLEGVYVSYAAGEDPADPTYQTFSAIIAKYASSTVPKGTATGAFVVLESFRRMMADYSGDYSSADLAKFIRGHEAIELPLTPGATAKCDSTAVPLVAIACTSAFSYSKLDKDGNATTFTVVKS